MRSTFSFCCGLVLMMALLIWPSAAFSQVSDPPSNGLPQNGLPDNGIVKTGEGIRSVTFALPEGKIVIILPDDVAAGDTISGVVVSLPNGKTDDEKAANNRALSAARLDIGAASGIAANGPFRITVANAPGANLPVTVYPIGNPVTAAQLPVSQAAAVAPSSFTLPTLGQSGRNIVLTGPFDGDSGNTHCSVGPQPASVLAESPRKAVCAGPTDVIGPTDLSIAEKGQTRSAPFRNVGVQLTSPKTALLRGEKTEVLAMVSGLQQLKTNIPFKIECNGVVTMSGGNSQAFQIRPGDVQKDGTYKRKFTVTGIETGVWSATGTVQTRPAQSTCYLAGQIVHVESNWGGKKGDWVIGIKELDGTKGYIHLGGDNMPGLKFCNWIKIGGCHTDENGLIWVDGYEMTTDPTRPPTKPLPVPTPTLTPPPPPPPPTPSPTPCKEGDTRDSTVETKDFNVMDGDSTVEFRVYTDKDSAVAAGKGMSEFWKGAKKVGDAITEHLPEGSTVAGWVLAYLDRGSEILDAVLASSLGDASVNSVTLDAKITVKHITATCTTSEVCEKGKWVKKKKYEEKSGSSSVPFTLVITPTDGEWDKITGSNARLDRKKLGEFAQQWLHDRLKELEEEAKAYDEFKKKCK